MLNTNTQILTNNDVERRLRVCNNYGEGNRVGGGGGGGRRKEVGRRGEGGGKMGEVERKWGWGEGQEEEREGGVGYFVACMHELE